MFHAEFTFSPKMYDPATLLDNAETNPLSVKQALTQMHHRGETVAEIKAFALELTARKIEVPFTGQKVFDVCGTGGTGKQRINLSTALALKLSTKFGIAKHGNRAASGKVGSFDLLERSG